MNLTSLIVSSAVAVAAPPSANFEEYGLCLRSEAGVAPNEADMPSVLVVARAIELCAEKRTKLRQQLISRQETHSQEDAALNAKQADKELVDFEIDRIRAYAERAPLLPSHSHHIIFEEKLPDAPNK